MGGRDSVFDTPTWLTMSVPKSIKPEYPSAERVEEYLTRVIIRLPCLIRLVRTTKQEVDGEEARTNATSLAAELYFDNLEDWLEQIKEAALIWTSPTTVPEYLPLVKPSFHLISTRLFNRLAQYWHLRCIVKGCVLALYDNRPIELPLAADFDTVSVVEHELYVAQCIAASVQWATAFPSILPMCEVHIVRPLMSAFSVWYRMEQRTISAAEVQHAQGLPLWVVSVTTAIGQKLNVPKARIDYLRRMHEISIGGPLPGPRGRGFVGEGGAEDKVCLNLPQDRECGVG